MIRYLSHLFSWVFLPLLMPLYGLLITMYYPIHSYHSSRISMYDIPPRQKWLLFAIFAAFSFIAPSLSYLGLYKFKIITTLDMEKREERNLPLIIMLIYGLLLFYLVQQIDTMQILPIFYSTLALSGVLVTTVFTILTRYLKISMHAGGAGILCGYLFSFFIQQPNPSLFWLCIGIVIAGTVIGSRWYLHKHTLRELVLGFSVAAFLTGIVVYSI